MLDKESWRTPSNVIACASLLVSILALVYACDAAQTARREAERKGSLEFSAVTPYLTNTLEGTLTSGKSRPQKMHGLKGPRVDITLSNRGSGSALLTRATVNVIRSDRLENCFAGTGGPEQIQTNYDVPIPLRGTPPFSQTKEIRFSVASGAHDRFTLTIGPGEPDADLTPWVGVIDIRLHDEDGNDLDIPAPIGLVSAGSDRHLRLEGRSWTIKGTANRDCMRRNAHLIHTTVQIPTIKLSKELEALDQALVPYR